MQKPLTCGVMASRISCILGMSFSSTRTPNSFQSRYGSKASSTPSEITTGTQPASAACICRCPWPPPMGPKQYLLVSRDLPYCWSPIWMK